MVAENNKKLDLKVENINQKILYKKKMLVEKIKQIFNMQENDNLSSGESDLEKQAETYLNESKKEIEEAIKDLN